VEAADAKGEREGEDVADTDAGGDALRLRDAVGDCR
jgi:hypothetical protein